MGLSALDHERIMQDDVAASAGTPRSQGGSVIAVWSL